jgi:uncharacterized cupredoxin-like copper-binding protein
MMRASAVRFLIAATAVGAPGGLAMATPPQTEAKTPLIETAIVTTVHVSFGKQVLGRMPLISDTTVAKAGTIEFIITNNSPKLKHTMFLAQIEDSTVGLQTKGFGSTVDTSASKLKYLAKFSNIDPLQTVMLTMDLWPGRYIIFCSRKHHYSKEGDVRFEIIK